MTTLHLSESQGKLRHGKRCLNVTCITHMSFVSISVCSSLSHRDQHMVPMSLVQNRIHFSFQLSGYRVVFLYFSRSSLVHNPKPRETRCLGAFVMFTYLELS
jgi:hypothetical protein